MNKSILMQKQVKDNADDLQKEFFDMKNWEEEMKRKDEELRKGTSGQTTLPPIRSKKKDKTKNACTKQNGTDNKAKRIKSYDYSAWDKFDVEKACKDVDKGEKSDESEDESMSKEELEKAHTEATKHKNKGNILVQKQEWSKAVGCYSEAIKIFPYDAVFYANRALCQLKLDNFYSAESDCSAAIQLDECYVKAYHRRATARMNLKQYKEAKHDLEKVLKLEPSNKEAKTLLAQVETKIKSSEKITGAKQGAEESIEKKIGEKVWSTGLNVQKTDIKSDGDTKQVKEKDIKKIINNKQSITDGKTDGKNIKLGKKTDPRIPSWLPEKDDVAVIEPIEKPPHLRSKDSLTKIPVDEVDFSSVQYGPEINKVAPSTSEPVQKKEILQDNILQEKESPADNIVQNNICTKVSELSDDSNAIPPPPKTAVQFVMIWKKHKSSEFRYKYLKQLSESSIPKIFKDSMESDIFSEILEVLKKEFINRKEPIFCYLKDLSDVKRFRALIMFLSNKEKEDLRVLFEHCETVENISQDEIGALRNKYEI